ncbi:hypothetical protein [Streptomyces roseoverticillatus]|uniref:hypothetical protein n=1 Tax=Streptomyces roseoverticillatus TaxID=66429 RepID=UPI0004C28CB4|nr:hypothetical protein [Streptomyces roseoverticillatus]
MAFTTTTRGPAGPHRRRVLAGGAAALLSAAGGGLLTGCSGGTGASSDASGRSGDERLRAAAGRASLDLLSRYDATLAVHGGLAERLRPLRGEVARHAEAFGAARGASDSSSPSSSSRSASPPGPSPAAGASSPAGSSSSPRADGVPGDEKAALTALADAERRTADSRTKGLGSASPELARLLASVAAAGAAHAYLLGSDS